MAAVLVPAAAVSVDEGSGPAARAVVAARSVAATAVAMHMVVARVAVMVEADRAAARVGVGC